MFTHQAERKDLALAPITERPAGQGAAVQVRNGIARFERDERGGVAIQFGLFASILIGFIGLAVDFGRWVNAREHTIAAMDAAVLAGGRAMQINGGDRAKAIQVASAYYAAAIRNRIPTFNDTITFTVTTTPKGQEVGAVGNAFVSTPFLATAYNLITNKTGSDRLAVLDTTTTPSKDASRALFSNGVGGNQSLEMAMMLDVSGSMASGTKFADMKAAAKDLIDIVIWPDQSKYTSRVSIVPFSGDVRLSSTMMSRVIAPNLLTSYAEITNTGLTYTWFPSNCVVERAGNERYSDAAPGLNQYITRGYDRSQVQINVGACASQSGNEVYPMSSSKDDVSAKVDRLVVGGNTGGHIGTAWTYYMLSPQWAQVVGAASAAAPYSDTKVKKIAVLMTDGEYNQVYRPIVQCRNSRGTQVACNQSGITVTTTTTAGIDDSGTANDSLNAVDSPAQAREICKKMKADGIEIYTVGFDLGGNQTAINTLSNCATDSAHFYNTTTGEQLRQAFRDIAVKSTKLVISN